MRSLTRIGLALVPWWLGACAGVATPGAGPAHPDALDAQAAVPPAAWSSPLAGYRAAGEVQPIDWKAANDTVTRIGGWRTYAREAAASAPSATPAPAASSPMPAMPGHPHHGGSAR
ncbi:MAG TPA: hypothetical protein VFQ16_05435 [Burkholderiaceae bacterium]|nr:hypothetical protein [Burkholderiaceae bacterium]